MHYIRCLRPPRLSGTDRASQVEVLFTITTDLGDSFLFPERPLELTVTAYAYSSIRSVEWLLSGKGQLVWQPGQRVLKPTFRLPPAVTHALTTGVKVQICISTSPEKSADGVFAILSGANNGLVMPVWLALNQADSQNKHVSTRKLRLGSPGQSSDTIEVDEEIGESIARHIWDAGVFALCAIAGTVSIPVLKSSWGSCMQSMKSILFSAQPLNILELGCGVGILGLGLASLCSTCPKRDCVVLMTDLEEADEQARSNISNLSDTDAAQVLYENLDWEDGKKGKFGPVASSHRWDIIMLSDCTYNVDMLPALVGTLSALHSANLTHSADGERSTTKVFLATKPRHSSERALFDLMSEHQWNMLEEQILRFPVIGTEPESVEMYLFEKS